MRWTPLGKHNPRLATLRKIVQERDLRRTVVDGPKLLRDLVARGFQPEELYASPEGVSAIAADPVLAPLPTFVPSYQLAGSVLQKLAPTRSSQGILALFPVPDYRQPAGDLVLFLDRLQDPANVGAIVRAAAAFGAGAVVCSPGCANPFSPKAVRAAAGASLFFPVLRGWSFQQLREWAGPRYPVVAATAFGGTPLNRWRPQRPLVLAVGNEGQGLDPAIEASVTQRVTIPLQNRVESLNVAVACGVLLACLTGACPRSYTG